MLDFRVKKAGRIAFVGGIFLTLFLPSFSYAFTTSAGYKVQVTIQNCNSNSVCEELLGETWYGCPLDCEAPVSTSTPTSTPGATPSGATGGFYSGEALLDVYRLFVNLFGPDYYGNNYPRGGVVAPSSSNIPRQTLPNTGQNTGQRTSLPSETVLVPSPSNVRVSFENGEVVLVWDYVSGDRVRFRVQRSTSGFPSDYLSGKLIYEGSGNYARDPNVLPDREYYYSIYAILNKGKGYSAPLVVKVRIPKDIKSIKTPTSVDPLIEDSEPVTLEPLTGKDLLCDSYLVPQISQEIKSEKNILIQNLIEKGYGPTNNITVSQNGIISLPTSGIYSVRHSPLVISFDKPESHDQESVVGMCLYRLNSDEKTSSYLFSQTSDNKKLFLVLSPNFIEKYRNPQYIFSIRMVKYEHSPVTLARGIIEVNDNQTQTIQKVKYTEIIEPAGVGLLRLILRKLIGF